MIPGFTQIYIRKEDIEDLEAFKRLLNLYNLYIEYEEPRYYILGGDESDLDSFKKFWI